MSQLRAHVPELGSPVGVLILVGIPILLFLVVGMYFTIEDLTWQFWLLDGEVVIGTLGFLLLSLFFRLKKTLISEYGEQAYRAAIRRFLFPGLAIIFAVVARIGYIPGPPIPHFWWYNVIPTLGWLLVIVGLLLWLRAVLAFGVDNLTMLYVYFPKDGQIVDSAIYSVIRHPIYAAVQRVAIGLALLNGNWFALTLSLIFALGIYGWVRLVEEKELLERFGSSYQEYRDRIPAFWPRFRDIGRFFAFILTGR